MKQVEVTIMGHGYVLGCPDGGDALLAQAVTSVDKEMSSIRDSGKVKARERIAVLAALNLAYQLADSASRPPLSTPASPRTDEMAVVEAELDGLLRRVDAALGNDGQLL